MGTKAEIEVAKENHCIIIPGITASNDYNNEAIKAILEDNTIMENINQKASIYKSLLIKREIPSEKDLLETIRGILSQ
ncbi:MAG: hypothetical protein Q7J67_02215 [bacterium]|nr:hypothetical protein [bacterium]